MDEGPDGTVLAEEEAHSLLFGVVVAQRGERVAGEEIEIRRGGRWTDVKVACFMANGAIASVDFLLLCSGR